MTADDLGQVTFEHVPGRFRALVQDRQVAEADYAVDPARPDVWTFDHTYADPQWRGTGLASRLVTYAMDTARTAGMRVVPQCPYLPGWFRRHPDYTDLLVS